MTRAPGPYVALLAGTIVLGLGSRALAARLPEFVGRFAGDVLWAAMVFWMLALARPAARTRTLAGAALVIAAVVELSQLYRSPWIDALRATRLGALALGQGFLWSDLACYVVGVAIAAGLDRWLATSMSHPS